MRLAVFASGRGTNFQALLDAEASGDLEAEVVLCISNTANAGALERAKSHGVTSAVITPDDHDSEEEFATALLDILREHDVDFVALAGYLKKVPRRVVHAFRGRMINIHPALLPAFGGTGLYGRRVHEAVIKYGARWTGVTVHLVDEEYDTGPIVLQVPIPVYPDDTADSLGERILEIEHGLFPQAVRLFAQNRVQVTDRQVRILSKAPSNAA